MGLIFFDIKATTSNLLPFLVSWISAYGQEEKITVYLTQPKQIGIA